MSQRRGNSNSRRGNRRQNYNHLDAGGRRFDEYVHNEEFPNPLETAARLREEQEKKDSSNPSIIWVLIEAAFYVVALLIISNMFSYHQELHQKNDCAMTYIYKPMIFNPIAVQGNTVRKYTLMQYHETYRDESTLQIDIPVLFVPGSSGSGKQIRSLGTTILNMTTELRQKFPYRYVIYACDFNEEFSFLSGATLLRQREFVVQSIETILSLYSTHGHKKLLLLGHSFGGTILYSLPAHRRFNPEWMDLVITLGAPINQPPFKPDTYMVLFYENAIKAWKNREKELKHVTIISYSGGHKDFMIPDHLARSPYKYTDGMQLIPFSRDTRVIFRPSWSLRDVGCEVDHNCLAWCNQLVKHIATLIMKYGMEWKVPNTEGKMKMSRQVVHDFYAQYTSPERAAPSKKEETNLFNNSIILQEEHRRVKITEEARYVAIGVDLAQYDLIVNVRSRAVNCPLGVHPVHADLTFRSSENFTSFSIQEGEWMNLRIMPTFLETSRLKGTIRIGGTPDCEYEIISTFDITGTLYRRLLDSTTLPMIVFCTLFFSSFIPLMMDNRLPYVLITFFGGRSEIFWMIFRSCAIVVLAMFCINNQPLVERNLVTFLIWILSARFVIFIVGMPVQWIIRGVVRVVEFCPRWIRFPTRLFLAALVMMLAVYNINFAYAFLLFLYIFKVGVHSKSGLCLLIFCIVILVSIGFAGNVRDGPAGIFERSLFDQYPSGFLDVLYVLFIGSPHPLLYSFIALVFSFLINTAELVQRIEVKAKEMLMGIIFVVLCVTFHGISNLESMVVPTASYVLLFEFYKEYRQLDGYVEPRIG